MKPIYCDNHVLVLEKPAGMATQPDFHALARAYIKDAYDKPGNVFLEPIHRLDKPVAGLILFARTSKALSRLNEAMRQKQLSKIYHAWVEGITEEQGTLRHHLMHGSHRAIVDPDGKEAVLHYRRLKTKGHTSLVEIELETGRYHQIRAQFGYIGHPVCGDHKYGAKEKREVIALVHVQLTFPHPITKDTITCQSSELCFA